MSDYSELVAALRDLSDSFDTSSAVWGDASDFPFLRAAADAIEALQATLDATTEAMTSTTRSLNASMEILAADLAKAKVMLNLGHHIDGTPQAGSPTTQEQP